MITIERKYNNSFWINNLTSSIKLTLTPIIGTKLKAEIMTGIMLANNFLVLGKILINARFYFSILAQLATLIAVRPD